MVMISGPSSSGKTTTTIKLEQKLIKKGFKFKALNVDHYFFDLEFHMKYAALSALSYFCALHFPTTGCCTSQNFQRHRVAEQTRTRIIRGFHSLDSGPSPSPKF